MTEKMNDQNAEAFAEVNDLLHDAERDRANVIAMRQVLATERVAAALEILTRDDHGIASITRAILAEDR